MKPTSGKAVCKALERKGWRLTRVRGTHHIYVSPDGRVTVPVPVHGNETIATGTQRTIMRQTGLTDADL